MSESNGDRDFACQLVMRFLDVYILKQFWLKDCKENVNSRFEGYTVIICFESSMGQASLLCLHGY